MGTVSRRLIVAVERPFRRLQRDHVGAATREDLRAEGPRQEVVEADDPDAREKIHPTPEPPQGPD